MSQPGTPLTRRRALALTGLGGLAALGLGLTGCSADDEGSTASGADDALDRIRSAGTIRIGMEGTFRPYGYHDSSGNLVGFEKEIADLVAADLGAQAQYVETQWDSLIAGVDAGRYDIVINNVAATDERKKSFDFSVPYMMSEGRVGVQEDSPLRRAEEVPGHSAAQTETSNFGQQMAAQGARVVPVTGFDEAVMLVHFGRVEMTGNDFVSFQTFFEQRPDVGIRLLEGTLGEPSPASILMAKGQTSLKKAIDASLNRRMDDGDLRRIYQKYVRTDLTPTTSQREA